jgi:hypothetical protein
MAVDIDILDSPLGAPSRVTRSIARPTFSVVVTLSEWRGK